MIESLPRMFKPLAWSSNKCSGLLAILIDRCAGSFFINLTQARVISGKKKPQLREWLHQIGLWASLIFFINVGELSRPWVTTATPGQAGGPGKYKKSCWTSQRKQASNQSSSVVSAPVSILELFHGISQGQTDYKLRAEISPFLPKLFLVSVLSHYQKAN